MMECSDFMQQLRSFKPQSLGSIVARRKSSTTLIFPLPPQACSGKWILFLNKPLRSNIIVLVLWVYVLLHLQTYVVVDDLWKLEDILICKANERREMPLLAVARLTTSLYLIMLGVCLTVSKGISNASVHKKCR